MTHARVFDDLCTWFDVDYEVRPASANVLCYGFGMNGIADRIELGPVKWHVDYTSEASVCWGADAWLCSSRCETCIFVDSECDM